jgi:long-chain fatty acid transport protein
VWLSLGGSYKLGETISIGLAYTHVFFDDAPIARDVAPTEGGPLLLAEAEQSADIVSFALKTTWGASAPLEPVK